MKKFLSVILVFVCAFILLSACGTKADNNGKFNVVCTVFPQYDFVKAIAGDKVNLTMLVPLGTESHDFKIENMTAADLKTVSSADLFIYIGGESDFNWINQLKKTVKADGIKWVSMLEMCETIEESFVGSMGNNQEHDHEHEGSKAYDEHVWTSPKRAKLIVKEICDVLCEIDSKNEVTYKANTQSLLNQLDELDRRLAEVFANKKSDTLIFADRFPFRYLCYDYSLKFDAAFPGCSAIADPSVAQITSLCEKAKEVSAKLIFYMENSNPIYARQIAEKCGAKAVMLHSCHTVTADELKSGVGYISLMESNIEKIAEALS